VEAAPVRYFFRATEMHQPIKGTGGLRTATALA
jgi:hypothetical protein